MIPLIRGYDISANSYYGLAYPANYVEGHAQQNSVDDGQHARWSE
jgi:hypothetical protein